MRRKLISRKNRFYTTLIKNYILFTFSTITILFIVICIAMFKLIGLLSILSDENNLSSQIDKLKDGRYQSIDTRSIEEEGGWIEVLDKKYNVIYSKGDVQDKRENYTKAELDALTNPAEIPYVINKYEFQNYNGENLIIVSKIPTKIIELNKKDAISTYVKNSIYQLLLVFIILYIINISIFIFWLNKKVKRPLEKIKGAMNKFTEINDEIYIDYKGEVEFVQICSSFNNMVRRLNTIEKEKKELRESSKRMLANISHDLKTPITTVQGYAKAISEGYVTDKDDIDSATCC